MDKKPDIRILPKISGVGDKSIKEGESSPCPLRNRRISRVSSPRPESPSVQSDDEFPTFQIYKYNKASTFRTGEGECGKCKKKIFATEKVWGPGKDNPWHKDCLNCETCGKHLETSTMQEHGDKPYCIACYNKDHAPLGVL